MKRTVLFVILQQYADWEVAYLSSAFHLLSPNMFSTKTVALTQDAVTSIGGFRTLPDYDIHCVPADYDGLILVGGLSWRKEEARLVEPLVQRALEEHKILGGICDAAGFLGTVGALNHVNHTGNDLKDLKQWAGSAYTGEKTFILSQAVRDGNIITANGTAAMEFAKEVLFALEAASDQKILEWYNFHKLGYYEAPLPVM